MDQIDWNKQAQKYRRLFEEYLAEQEFGGSPESLYGPLRYIMRSGGKRFRPAACLMSCRCYSEHYERSLPQALALEIFHTFSLVHDDIMDRAPLRRGKASVHEKWNLNQAILSGDLMLVLAFRYLTINLDDSLFREVSRVFTRAAIAVCEGQQLDMDFERVREVDESAYLEMIRKKSAALLGASAQIGALVGGASEENAQHFYNFFELTGQAFQIQDDILDAYGDQEITGKKRGGDIARDKRSLLSILLEAEADDDGLERIGRLGKESEKIKIEKTLQWYDKYDIRRKAVERRDRLFEAAVSELDELGLEKGPRDRLHIFAQSFIHRNY